MIEIAAVWCWGCDQPATGPDGSCDRHRNGTPITAKVGGVFPGSGHETRAQRRERCRLETVAYYESLKGARA